jgi:hypothetical protein
MKIRIIAAAAAVFCAQSAFADAAYDAAVTKIGQAVASGKVLRMTGASAMAASIRGAVAKSCAGNKIDAAFISGASTLAALGNYFVYVCTAKDVTTANFGSNPFFNSGANNSMVVVVSHEGSATSIQGAVGTLPMVMLQTSLAGCTQTSIGNLSVQGLNVPAYNGCTTAAQAGSIGGFSDVEGDLFANVIASGGLVSSPDVVSTPSTGAQVFTVAASRPLYRAMQAAQGITSADCTNDTQVANATGTGATTVVGSNDFSTPACQPSISKQQYATIAASANKDALGEATNPWALLGLSNPSKNMRLARRVDLSGTQASSNAFFLNLNCANGPHGGQLDPVTAGTYGTGRFIVTADTGTSGAIAKLNAGNGTGTVGTANDHIIGVISAENALRSTDSFGFLKIDGVSATEDARQRQSSIDGRYNFNFEFVLHSNASGSGINKDYMTLLNDLIGGDPSDVDSPDLTGVYTLPLGFANSDFPTRVGKSTKGGNNCAPANFAL